MRFRITPHAGHDAPADALEQLLDRLSSGRRIKGRFYKVGSEIRVTWGRDDSNGWDRPERLELEREELLDVLRDACRKAPPMQLEWYTISPLD
jgi:hypothetical protein